MISLIPGLISSKTIKADRLDVKDALSEKLSSELQKGDVQRNKMLILCKMTHRCDKRFTRQKSLKTHMTILTVEKNHVCKIYDIAFSQELYLIKHMVTQAG
jgi:uncharacterized Zn-finger protein